MISLPISALLKDKEFQLALGLATDKRGLTKKILIPQIQKPGLALTGYTSNLHPGRIQVLGNSEIHFLENLPPEKQRSIIKKICQVDIACFVITHNNQIPPALIQEASRRKIAVLKTSLSTPVFVIRITKFLENKLTESATTHGVLVDVFGVGVLLLGKSGIGKSECALELVMKGHRLVADDVVMLQKKSPTALYGSGSDLIKYHMEIRGLGIINIKDLFGVTSVRDQKLVELVIELLEWNPRKEYERLGIDQQYYEIMGVKIPWLQIPVRPGRSMTSVIEVAARNHLLKLKGFYSAREFQTKLTRELLETQVGRGRIKGLVE